jgi:hypothetical protein
MSQYLDRFWDIGTHRVVESLEPVWVLEDPAKVTLVVSEEQESC